VGDDTKGLKMKPFLITLKNIFFRIAALTGGIFVGDTYSIDETREAWCKSGREIPSAMYKTYPVAYSCAKTFFYLLTAKLSPISFSTDLDILPPYTLPSFSTPGGTYYRYFACS